MFKSYEDVMTFNKANMDALVQSGTKFATGFEAITKEAFTFTSKAMESAMENAKTLATMKNPSEAIALQQKLAKEAWEASVAETNRLAEMSTVVSKSALEPIQARYKVAFEGIKIAA